MSQKGFIVLFIVLVKSLSILFPLKLCLNSSCGYINTRKLKKHSIIKSYEQNEKNLSLYQNISWVLLTNGMKWTNNYLFYSKSVHTMRKCFELEKLSSMHHDDIWLNMEFELDRYIRFLRFRCDIKKEKGKRRRLSPKSNRSKFDHESRY